MVRLPAQMPRGLSNQVGEKRRVREGELLPQIPINIMRLVGLAAVLSDKPPLELVVISGGLTASRDEDAFCIQFTRRAWVPGLGGAAAAD